MSGNRLIVAVIVLGALLGLTVLMFNKRESEDAGPASVTVKLNTLKKEDVDALEVSVPGKTPVKLAKQGEQWTLTAPVATPADPSAVDSALSKLAELEVTGVAATKAENHGTLEVDDAQAVHVVASKAGQPVLDLLIGTYRSGNTMVRKPSENTVATVKGSIKFAFDKEVRDWRNRTIIETSADEVSQITFENQHGVFRFVQTAGAWQQAPGDKPIPGFDPEQLKPMVASATTMNASDFVDTPPATPEAPLGSVTFVVGEPGQTITLRVGPKHGDDYIVTREGNDTVYLISAFVAERLLPTPDKFAKPPEPAAEGEAAASVKKVPVKK